MVSNQRKQEKLARRLMPNQSIRADQKKSSSHQARLPISVSPGIQAVKVVDWFDCSKNTDSKNEDCLKMLFEMIDSPPSTTKATNRGGLVPLGYEGNNLQETSESGETTHSKQSETRAIKIMERRHRNYLKYRHNPNFLLGLNSTLKCLENVRLVLVQLVALVRDGGHRIAGDQDECNQAEPDRGDRKKLDIRNASEFEKEPSDVMRDLESIRFIIIFKHHQHLSVINLLSTFIDEINQALFLLNTHKLPTPNPIKLVAFPLALNSPLLTKFSVRRLSCFAILDSTPGIEQLDSFFVA